MLRQVLYTSTSTSSGGEVEVDAILRDSRHNNALDGLSGVLWVNGEQFIQVLEGPRDTVAETMSRILRDSRHHRIEILVDREIDKKEFGDWSMALRHDGETRDELNARIRSLVSQKSGALGLHFDKMLRGASNLPLPPSTDTQTSSSTTAHT